MNDLYEAVRSGAIGAIGGLMKVMLDFHDIIDGGEKITCRHVFMSILYVALSMLVGATIGLFMPDEGPLRDGLLLVSGMGAIRVIRAIQDSIPYVITTIVKKGE